MVKFEERRTQQDLNTAATTEVSPGTDLSNSALENRPDLNTLQNLNTERTLFASNLDIPTTSSMDVQIGEIVNVLGYLDRAAAAQGERINQADSLLSDKDFKNVTPEIFRSYVYNESITLDLDEKVAQQRADRAQEVYEKILEDRPNIGWGNKRALDYSKILEASSNFSVAVNQSAETVGVNYKNRTTVTRLANARQDLADALGSDNLSSVLDGESLRTVEEFIATHSQDVQVHKTINGARIDAGDEKITIARSSGTNIALGGQAYTIVTSTWAAQRNQLNKQ